MNEYFSFEKLPMIGTKIGTSLSGIKRIRKRKEKDELREKSWN